MKLPEMTSSQYVEAEIDLSIIVVNYKTPSFTLQCVRSIVKHAPSSKYEVIVFDNGSDGTLRRDLARDFPDVLYLSEGKNLGFAKANNRGMQRSRGRYILLLNSDTKFKSNSLQPMLDYMDKKPSLGALGPRQISGDGKFSPTCGHFPTLYSEMIRKIMHYRLSIDDYQFRDFIDEKHFNRRWVDWLSGSCMMIRRRTLWDAGLLDERFFMYFEDIELCYRIKNSGWQIQYFPEQTLVHFGGQSAKQNILKVMYENRKSQLYFSRRYYGRWGSLLVRLFLLTKYAFNLVKWSLIWCFLRLFNQSNRSAYARILISKKVFMMNISTLNSTPRIPAFPAFEPAPIRVY